MGNGEIVLILDVSGLAQNALMVSGKSSRDELIESASASRNDADETQDMLIVSLGNNRRMAIRLTDVARLEELTRSDLETSGSEKVIQYRDEIMHLIDLPALFNLSHQETCEKIKVVVHIHEGKSLGLVVENILDIVQSKINEKRAIAGSNLLGTIITENSLVDVINIKNIVQKKLETT